MVINCQGSFSLKQKYKGSLGYQHNEMNIDIQLFILATPDTIFWYNDILWLKNMLSLHMRYLAISILWCRVGIHHFGKLSTPYTNPFLETMVATSNSQFSAMDTQAPVHHQHYNDSHRLFMQSMLSHRLLTESRAQELYTRICEVTEGERMAALGECIDPDSL